MGIILGQKKKKKKNYYKSNHRDESLIMASERRQNNLENGNKPVRGEDRQGELWGVMAVFMTLIAVVDL